MKNCFSYYIIQGIVFNIKLTKYIVIFVYKMRNVLPKEIAFSSLYFVIDVVKNTIFYILSSIDFLMILTLQR